MKTVIEDATVGKIVYEESFWTGGKKLYVNGEELVKVSKKSFQTKDGQIWNIAGNYLRGASWKRASKKSA